MPTMTEEDQARFESVVGEALKANPQNQVDDILDSALDQGPFTIKDKKRKGELDDLAVYVVKAGDLDAGYAADAVSTAVKPEERPYFLRMISQVAEDEPARAGLSYPAKVARGAARGVVGAKEAVDRILHEAVTGEKRDQGQIVFAKAVRDLREQSNPLNPYEANALDPRGWPIRAGEMAVPQLVSATLGIGRLPTTAFWTTQIFPDELQTMREAGLKDRYAYPAAAVSSIAQAAVETLNLHALIPRASIGRIAQESTASALKHGAKSWAKEVSEEGWQSAISDTTKAIATRLDEQAPDSGMGQIFTNAVDQMVQAAGPLSVMMAPGAAGSAMRARPVTKGQLMKVAGAARFAQEHPEAAQEMASAESPSRTMVEKLIESRQLEKENWNKGEREQVAQNLRDVLAGKAQSGQAEGQAGPAPEEKQGAPQLDQVIEGLQGQVDGLKARAKELGLSPDEIPIGELLQRVEAAEKAVAPEKPRGEAPAGTPPAETPITLERPTGPQEVRNAEGIRGNEGQVRQGGLVAEAGQTQGGKNLQLPAGQESQTAQAQQQAQAQVAPDESTQTTLEPAASGALLSPGAAESPSPQQENQNEAQARTESERIIEGAQTEGTLTEPFIFRDRLDDDTGIAIEPAHVQAIRDYAATEETPERDQLKRLIDIRDWNSEAMGRSQEGVSFSRRLDKDYRSTLKAFPVDESMTVYAYPGTEEKAQEIAEKAKQMGKRPTKIRPLKKPPIPKPKTVKLPKPDLSNKARIKRLSQFTGESSRYSDLDAVKVEKDRAFATDGWSLHIIQGDFSDHAPGVYAPTSKGQAPTLREGKPSFPDITDRLIPQRSYTNVVQLSDLAQEIRRASNAAIMAPGGIGGGVAIAINPDGTIGYAAWDPSTGQAEVNIKEGAKVLGAVEAGRFIDALELHASQGAKSVRMQFPDAKQAMLLESPRVTSVIMPRKWARGSLKDRIEGAAPEPAQERQPPPQAGDRGPAPPVTSPTTPAAQERSLGGEAFYAPKQADAGEGALSAADRGPAAPGEALPGGPPASIDNGTAQGSGGPGRPVKGTPLPELVRMTRAIQGDVPLVKKLGGALGRFRRSATKGVPTQILVDPSAADNPNELAQVLAHEMGHLQGYLKGYLDEYGNKDIRQELIALSKWWTPYDENADKKYRRYRESSKELYAQALSVLLTAPREVMNRAPGFWKGFWDYADRKPEVLREYLNIQDQLFGIPEQLQEIRRAATHEGYLRAENVARQRSAEMEERRRSALSDLFSAIVDRAQPILRSLRSLEKRGVDIADNLNPRYALNEWAHRRGKMHLWLKSVREQVEQPLLAAGIDGTTIGDFLKYRRETTERSKIANPGGHTAETAQKQLDYIRSLLGNDRYALLEKHTAIFDDLVYGVVGKAVKAGIYSKKIYEETLLPNKGKYATFAVAEYASDFIPAEIQKQIGTFKDIANPFTATMAKMVSLHRAIAANEVKSTVREFYKTYLPDEINLKRVRPGKAPKPSRPGYDYLTVMENGKPTYYEVDAYVTKVFNGSDLNTLNTLGRIMRQGFNIFHKLWVTYSVGWNVMNPQRDLQRTYKGIVASLKTGAAPPSLGAVLKAYYHSLGPSFRRAAGRADPLIDEMMANGTLDVPFVSYDFTDDSTIDERLMSAYGVRIGTSQQEKRNLLMQALSKLGNGVEAFGVAMETLPKVATHKVLEASGVTGKARDYIVRTYVGTPDFMVKGEYTEFGNGLFTYLNVALQGMRTEVELASNPRTRGAWMVRTAMLNVMPKLVMMGAAYGLYGDLVKSLFDMIPEYDLTKYICIPVGWRTDDKTGEKKTVYLRFAHDDVGRLLAGTMWKAFAGRREGVFNSLQDVLGVVAGEAPGLSPLVTIPGTWVSWMTGINPRDSYRGRDILSRDAFESGDWFAGAQDMGAWTMNQFGVLSDAARFFVSRPGDLTSQSATIEKVFDAPGLSRIIKISNRGISEQQWIDVDKARAESAQRHLKLDDTTNSLMKERYRLNLVSEERLSEHDARKRAILNAFGKSDYLPIGDQIRAAEEGKDAAEADRLRGQLKDAAEKTRNLIVNETDKMVLQADRIRILERLQTLASNRPIKKDAEADWQERRQKARDWLQSHNIGIDESQAAWREHLSTTLKRGDRYYAEFMQGLGRLNRGLRETRAEVGAASPAPRP